jgi:alpha-tubulin suppressor-like RCC1 family protein
VSPLRARTARAAGAMMIVLSQPLLSQGQRDSLGAGRRAWEQASFDAAARLLPIGLVTARRDTAWAAGVHMLLDVLLSRGDTSGADLWARWAARTFPALRPDERAFPPRVTARIAAARGAVEPLSPDDTLIGATFEPLRGSAGRLGELRLVRGEQPFLLFVGPSGTLLPGEARSLPPGTYTMRVIADGQAPLELRREILPGMATTLTITPRGPGAVAPSVAVLPMSLSPRGPQVSAGGLTTCQILAGRAICWGDNRHGQFGAGAADTVAALGTAAGDAPWVTVALGAGHACGLTRTGGAWCWGQGSRGQLGNGSNSSSSTPVRVAGGPFVTVAAGAAHSCALDPSGQPWCWGANHEGELGTRSFAASAVPVAVAMPPGTAFVALETGSAHSCGLTGSGAAWCWGANGSGQVGAGSTAPVTQPTPVLGGISFRSLALGQAHSCGVSAAGAAWCWGANWSGQLGNGQIGVAATRPASVSGLDSGIVTVVAGDAHSCVLTTALATFCWGAGRTGQLGNAQAGDSPRPVLVVGGHDFQALSAGTAHSCGTSADGTTWCWGDNSAGQVGSLAGRLSATALPTVLRPARSAAAANVAELRELFDADRVPAGWVADSARGGRIEPVEGAVLLAGAPVPALARPVALSAAAAIPVRRETALSFDVMVEHAAAGCGLNCAAWPIAVRVRARNSDLSESELWIVYGDAAAAPRTLSGLAIVPRPGQPLNAWRRAERFVIRDYLPRADTVLEVSIGGLGEFAARFDNVVIPAAPPASLVLERQSTPLTRAAPSRRLAVQVRGARGDPLPWVVPVWVSSDSSVVRVDQQGVATAVRAGTVWIRARAGAAVDSVRVRSEFR